MSNKVINAVIALVEERPSVAREMLRSPELKISISEVQARLSSALSVRENRAKVSALKEALMESLRIDTDQPNLKLKATEREAFLLGVATVEQIIEGIIFTYES